MESNCRQWCRKNAQKYSGIVQLKNALICQFWGHIHSLQTLIKVFSCSEYFVTGKRCYSKIVSFRNCYRNRVRQWAIIQRILIALLGITIFKISSRLVIQKESYNCRCWQWFFLMTTLFMYFTYNTYSYYKYFLVIKV